ncbi:hypothetical protein ACWA1C_06000 [Flectobacillus roseus]
MKRFLLSVLGTAICTSSIVAQTSTTSSSTTASTPAKTEAPAEQKVTVYGFVRNDIYYNTRRNLDLRDGVLDVYPSDATNLPTRSGTTLTPNGSDDANAIPQLGYSAIVTRLGVKFGGISAFGAKASGILETDFFGITNGTAGTSGGGTENLLRLRHAYVALDWAKTQLLVGQYWNPNFIPKCFPGTANFNTGIPFNPFSFIPQVRLTHKLSNLVSFTGILFGYDLQGFSPAGAFGSGTGVDAYKYATTPSFAAQLGVENKKFLASFGLEGNTIRPRITDTQNPSTGAWGGTGAPNISKNITTNLFTLNLLAYAKYTSSKLTAKFHTTYGQSYTQYVGLGGLAEYRNATTGEWKYAAQNQWNLWGELISTKSKSVQPAIFVGYLKNLGLSDAINKSDIQSGSLAFLGRGISATRTFDSMFRLAPRVDFYSGKMKFALEYEISAMKWADVDGTVPNAAGTLPSSISFKPASGDLARSFTATNHRLQAVVVYNF